MDDHAVQDRVVAVEQALERVEGLPPGPRATALAALSGLVDLYGEAWTRALARAEDLRPGAASALAADELVGHLLMIHDLHPESLEARVRDALEGVGAVLVDFEDGVARVRLTAVPEDAGAGYEKLVRECVLSAAPELRRVEVAAPPSRAGGAAAPALVQLRRSPAPPREGV